MVIGETFAYGHIPKTGGDAVHAWLAQLGEFEIDPLSEPRKHDFFWQRGVQRDLYVLSIRRLPQWALSYLHELAGHPAAARHYGIPPGDVIRPEHAFRLRPDDYLCQHQAGGRAAGVWLRMEHLFQDFVSFVDAHIQPVTPQLRRQLQAVPTKGRRPYDHNVRAFFSPEQIADLYNQFPMWAAVERQVYDAQLRQAA